METTESFQQQALPVRQPDENFDIQLFEPKDGEEYLMKVIYERSQCPAVVVKTPKNVNRPSTSVEAGAEQCISSDGSDSTPSFRTSKEWKDAQYEDFQIMREKISLFRQQLESNGYSSENSMPLVDKSEGWNQFCRLNEPYLSIMLRINQRSLEKLLEFQCEWLQFEIERETIDLIGEDSWIGKWIYSTMACLRMPLEPDVHSSLRDIARKLILLRNKLKSSDQFKVAPYNLFIFLIAKCFEQLDFLEFV